MIDRVQAALDAMQREGSFAARLRCPANDLTIEVRGVGVLRFPLLAATARKLSSVARPAPFGLREQTLHDPNIRDTGQIRRSAVKIDSRRWKPVLQAHLAQIQRNLGLPAEGALGLAPLYRHVEDSLTQSAAEPPRSDSDWSIVVPLSCHCALCAKLSAFLSHPQMTRFEWPLAKDRRQHIHHILDGHHLPVSHETTRRGSPFTLVLTKQPVLFQHAAALRKKQQEFLAWLTQEQTAFCDVAADDTQCEEVGRLP